MRFGDEDEDEDLLGLKAKDVFQVGEKDYNSKRMLKIKRYIGR